MYEYIILAANFHQWLHVLSDYIMVLSDDSGMCRQHTHSGSAHGFSFQVVFVVREEKVGIHNDATYIVVWCAVVL